MHRQNTVGIECLQLAAIFIFRITRMWGLCEQEEKVSQSEHQEIMWSSWMLLWWHFTWHLVLQERLVCSKKLVTCSNQAEKLAFCNQMSKLNFSILQGKKTIYLVSSFEFMWWHFIWWDRHKIQIPVASRNVRCQWLKTFSRFSLLVKGHIAHPVSWELQRLITQK